MAYKNRKHSDLVKMTTRAIVRAHNQGLVIDPYNYGISPEDQKPGELMKADSTYVCAVGALGVGRKIIRGNSPRYVRDYVADSLNEDRDLIHGISAGFMGANTNTSFNSPHKKGIEIAQAVRSNLQKLGIPIVNRR